MTVTILSTFTDGLIFMDCWTRATHAALKDDYLVVAEQAEIIANRIDFAVGHEFRPDEDLVRELRKHIQAARNAGKADPKPDIVPGFCRSSLGRTWVGPRS